MVAEANSAWNRELDVLEAKGTPDQLAMFYTSLYHTMINPSVYMDVDGRYRGLDHNIHTSEGFTNYTIFSLWDTYRAEHPFLELAKTPAEYGHGAVYDPSSAAKCTWHVAGLEPDGQ